MIDVGGRGLSVQLEGEGTPTVVFESGGGEDASVWSSIAPEAQRRSHVRTVVYDRAGLGKSDPAPLPYSIDDEATSLKTALDRADVRGDIVLVAHSYGGFVATLVAASDPRVVGLVLIDANLPGSLDDVAVARLLARYRPQYDELRQARPDLARVMIPLMEAYPATVERMRPVSLPATLPIIDIVAEHSWGDTPEENESLRRAHAVFVAESAAREAVLANDSGHNVMRDRPDIVLGAITSMITRVRAESDR